VKRLRNEEDGKIMQQERGSEGERGRDRGGVRRALTHGAVGRLRLAPIGTSHFALTPGRSVCSLIMTRYMS
jgi:hypothetical protein